MNTATWARSCRVPALEYLGALKVAECLVAVPVDIWRRLVDHIGRPREIGLLRLFYHAKGAARTGPPAAATRPALIYQPTCRFAVDRRGGRRSVRRLLRQLTRPVAELVKIVQ